MEGAGVDPKEEEEVGILLREEEGEGIVPREEKGEGIIPREEEGNNRGFLGWRGRQEESFEKKRSDLRFCLKSQDCSETDDEFCYSRGKYG
ncbi:hypothetical protein G5I_08670 [Acromyrmex echinatior]|uniref:Uncharacterized protein n=1 Tax=Acromyrmex echinatior TaxID=103372 RepID=F4WS59_ACREC|nr:hypothetical protein G5I_08670 [Acromyrmex echinatior]